MCTRLSVWPDFAAMQLFCECYLLLPEQVASSDSPSMPLLGHQAVLVPTGHKAVLVTVEPPSFFATESLSLPLNVAATQQICTNLISNFILKLWKF